MLVSLDDAVIAHPYLYETPTGGLRGAVDPLLITEVAFSTGGFSARHGNALSAVMDLRGLDRPDLPEISGTFGLAGAAAGIGLPLSEGAGVRGAVNRTFTGLLFAVNGSPRRFAPAPEGWDGSGGLSWDVDGVGSVKTFAMVQQDSVGVEAEQDAFAGWLSAANRHSFVSARWDGVIGAAAYYDRVRGAERLAPMRAVHHIVGYETGREAEGLHLRVEGYVKQYCDLPLLNAPGGQFSSAGHGPSKGVDLFVQRRSSRLDVRAMASWLEAGAAGPLPINEIDMTFPTGHGGPTSRFRGPRRWSSRCRSEAVSPSPARGARSRTTAHADRRRAQNR